MDKYVLITNANNYIGKELVKKFISDNYMVFATDKKYDNKKFGNLIYINLDPDNPKSLDNAKKNMQRYTSKVDAILHLADHKFYNPLIETDLNDLKESIKINFYQIYKMNQVLWDLLGIRDGKIIHDCTDSVIGELAPFNGAYAIAKGLLKNYNDVLARELKSMHIDVIRVHTGPILDDDFEFWRNSYLKTAENSKLFHSEMTRFLEMNMNKNEVVTIEEYCDLMLRIVNSKKPRPVYELNVNNALKKTKRMSDRKLENYFIKYK